MAEQVVVDRWNSTEFPHLRLSSWRRQILQGRYGLLGLLLAVGLVAWLVMTHGIERAAPSPAQLDAATSVERANTGEAAASRGEK